MQYIRYITAEDNINLHYLPFNEHLFLWIHFPQQSFFWVIPRRLKFLCRGITQKKAIQHLEHGESPKSRIYTPFTMYRVLEFTTLLTYSTFQFTAQQYYSKFRSFTTTVSQLKMRDFSGETIKDFEVL
jgi:hypothetical protein